MKIPWDDYDEYCRKMWAQAEEHWREGTRRLEALERTRIAWEQEQRDRQEQWHKENARVHEERRQQREAERLKENARARAKEAYARREQERRRLEQQELERAVRYQTGAEREQAQKKLERRERHRAAAIEGQRRARERKEQERAERARAVAAGATPGELLDDYEDERYGIQGVTLEHLEELTGLWEAGHRLEGADSGYYQAAYWMRTESFREQGLVRMAEAHCERLAGKHMYARPFSQMKQIPCGYQPPSIRQRLIARAHREL